MGWRRPGRPAGRNRARNRPVSTCHGDTTHTAHTAAQRTAPTPRTDASTACRFQRLRELFKIDPLQQDVNPYDDFKPEGRCRLHAAMEKYVQGNFTGGASGAFMYFSGDQRFIVKQVYCSSSAVL